MKIKSYQGVSIQIDDDAGVGYERHEFLRSIANRLLIFILNFLPKSSRFYIKKSHRSAEEVIEHATTHHALEILYQGGKTYKSQNVTQRIAHLLWFGIINNSIAVRNRLKLVKKELRITLQFLLNSRKTEIRVLSIASGSARAIVEVLSSVPFPPKMISVKFLDKDSKAIEYSRQLVNGLESHCDFSWVNDTASKFPAYYTAGEKPDIIEMVGLMDYFDDAQVIKIFGLIYRNLSDGGFFITANILPNHESRFVTNVVGWKMVYRSPQKLINLAITAGFDASKLKVTCEPLRIHMVLIAQK